MMDSPRYVFGTFKQSIVSHLACLNCFLYFYFLPRPVCEHKGYTQSRATRRHCTLHRTSKCAYFRSSFTYSSFCFGDGQLLLSVKVSTAGQLMQLHDVNSRQQKGRNKRTTCHHKEVSRISFPFLLCGLLCRTFIECLI